MKINSIISLLLSISLLAACSSPNSASNDSTKQNIAVHDQIKVDDKKLEIVAFNKLDENTIPTIDEPDIDWIKDDLSNDKDVYLLEYKLSYELAPTDYSLNFSLKDDRDNEIPAKDMYVTTDESINGRVYFSIQKGRPVSSVNINGNIDGTETSLSSIINETPINISEGEDMYIMKDKLSLQTIDLAPDVKVEIYDYGNLEASMMNENEKSNMQDFLSDPDNKIHFLEYRISDSRNSGKVIDREMVSGIDDVVTTVVTDKNNKKITPVSVYADVSTNDGEYNIREYYVLEKDNELKHAEFAGLIDGEKITDKYVDLNSKNGSDLK